MQIIVAQTGTAVVISQPTICHKSPCQDCQKLDSTVGDAPSQALGYERSHHYLFRLQRLNRQWYEKKAHVQLLGHCCFHFKSTLDHTITYFVKKYIYIGKNK